MLMPIAGAKVGLTNQGREVRKACGIADALRLHGKAGIVE